MCYAYVVNFAVCCYFIAVHNSAYVRDDELAVLTKTDFLQTDELY